MRIHLAGANSFKEVILENKVPNTLFSFIDLKRRDDLPLYMRQYDFCEKIIIDSGAYSMWAVGRSVDIDEYIRFCKKLMEFPRGDRFIFVNLDVIPGKKEVMPTKEERIKSAEQSWENMMYMFSRGVRCLPVFHQHEPMEFLDRISEVCDYVGISPSNDRWMTNKLKKAWLDSIYMHIRTRIKTHGFGVTSGEILKRYPFYSADSTSWIDPKKYGHSLTTNLKARGLKRKAGQGIEGKHGKIMLWELHNEVKRWLELEKQITRMWAQRGVVWE
jgi:hypothetical protein